MMNNAKLAIKICMTDTFLFTKIIISYVTSNGVNLRAIGSMNPELWLIKDLTFDPGRPINQPLWHP